MKRQIGVAEAEIAGKKRVTRRQRFLAEMEKIVPWQRLLLAIEPHYPKGTRGHPPIGLERMLRIYFLQQCYGLSDEGLEDALYDSIALRAFAGIDLAVEDVPDATTLLKFRRLLIEFSLFALANLVIARNAALSSRFAAVRVRPPIATIGEVPFATKNGCSLNGVMEIRSRSNTFSLPPPSDVCRMESGERKHWRD
ncbi:transposase, IS5 family [Paraburkholderia sartisoli]|uniref:Transposase, IS5 family n=1 Tax=Paraburkholderia sartisoli TaxID=83784 RepID=A0A1H4A3H2_9BURK|nr:transposase, IS5 family [Paraburkholderia sartisoli]